MNGLLSLSRSGPTVNERTTLDLNVIIGDVSGVPDEIAAVHPYDVPEIIVVEPSAVNRAYAAWVIDECAT